MRIASIRNILNQWTQKIMTMDANKITRLMGLIIMKANKKFQSNRLLRIFRRSNGISKTFAKHMINWGMSGYSISARINRRGIQVTKNSRAVSSKDYQTTTSVTGYLVITRPTGDECKNNNCK